jgi:putative transposase
MAQVARNLTDAVDGFLRGKKKFVVDRDAKFTEAFRKTFAGAGVETVQTALRAPNMNAVAERFVKTIKDECLSRMVFFGQGMFRRAIGP